MPLNKETKPKKFYENIIKILIMTIELSRMKGREIVTLFTQPQ